MTILTREAIQNINDYYRLGDAADEAHFYGESDIDAELMNESQVFRAKVTEEQLYAYADANIQPPHKVGHAKHDAMVDAYFASVNA